MHAHKLRMSHPKGGTRFSSSKPQAKAPKMKHTPEYWDVACVGSRFAYPYQCYSINKFGHDKKQLGCTMHFKWVARVLIMELEEGEQH